MKWNPSRSDALFHDPLAPDWRANAASGSRGPGRTGHGSSPEGFRIHDSRVAEPPVACVWGKETQSQGGGWLESARVGLRRRAGRHIKDRAGGRVERDRPTRWRGSTPWVCSRLKPPWEARREREVQNVGEPASGKHAPELPLRARAVPWVQESRQGSGGRLRPFLGPHFLGRGDPAEALPGPPDRPRQGRYRGRGGRRPAA